MNRSVCKVGLAAALVLGALAFSATPAHAQVYVSRYYASTPVYSYYYPPSYPSYEYPSYYYAPAYPSYYSTPTYSYYYAPAYSYYYPDCGWRGRWGWYGHDWHGRRWWR